LEFLLFDIFKNEGRNTPNGLWNEPDFSMAAAVAGIMPGGSPKQEPAEAIACGALACNAVGIPGL
jgi:hypothetical protein